MATNRIQYLNKMGLDPDDSYSIEELAGISGISKGILQEVFNRAVGAWKTNLPSVRLKVSFKKNPDTTKFPRSARLSAEQWGYARIYSFLNGGKTRHTADLDLWKRHLRESK